MQTAFYTKSFGGPVNDVFGQLPMPKAGVPGRLLIKVTAAALNPIDYIQREAKMPKFLIPKLPCVQGFDFCGIVQEDGKRFKKGDKVFGCTKLMEKGTCAEYISVSEDICALKPENVSDEEAASVPLVGITALQAWEKCGLKANEDNSDKRVLILGGAGGVGTVGIQIAKNYFGVGFVATTASPGTKTDLCKRLGADLVVNYKDDPSFIKVADSLERPFDCIIYSYGDLNVLAKPGLVAKGCKVIGLGGVPTAQGLRTFIEGSEAQMPFFFRLMLTTSFGNWFMNHVIFSAAAAEMKFAKFGASYEHFASISNKETIEALAELISTGKLVPVVEKVFDFKDCKEAMALLEKGTVGGKVCIKFDAEK